MKPWGSRTALALVAALGLAGMACSDREEPGAGMAGDGGTPAGGRSPAATTEPGRGACAGGPNPAIVPGQTSSLSVVSNGRGRTYLLYAPPGYDGTRPLPLVLNFHGLGSNGEEQHRYSGLVPIAEREGFLVASPDGINRAWLTNPWVNDIAFTKDLVAEISRLACVDAGRVYATGMSNGGFMSAALACAAGDVVAAVAPVAGMTGVSELCGEPVPFIEFHGTDDRIVPYEPGIVAPTGGAFAGVPALMEEYAMSTTTSVAAAGVSASSRSESCRGPSKTTATDLTFRPSGGTAESVTYDLHNTTLSLSDSRGVTGLWSGTSWSLPMGG